jgi:5-methylcytosine-specific restriction endonuclease McrA
VREPRPGLAWSLRRARCRAEYSAWMGGEAWLARRAAWYRRWVAAHEAEPVCQVCESTWTLRRGHLHHLSYARLGHEADRDLVPLCRSCHQRLHRVLESNPAWLKAGRAHATGVIIARLRPTARKEREQRQGRAGPGPEASV